MISTLGWRKLSTCLHCSTYIWELSYKVPELLHQGIIFLGKVAGINSEKDPVSARRAGDEIYEALVSSVQEVVS